MFSVFTAKMSKVVASLATVFLFAGCIATYTIPPPRQVAIEGGRVAEVLGGGPVGVTNAQTNTEYLICLGNLNRNTLKANLRAWTDTAVGVLSSELNRRSIPVTDDAEKELKLAIVEIQHIDNSFTSGFLVKIRVQTGDGYSIMHQSEATSFNGGGGFGKAAAVAVARTVAEVLNDTSIRKYLGAAHAGDARHSNEETGTKPDEQGTVKITATPASADIYLDGVFVGNSSAEQKVKAGTHAVEVKNPGFKSFKREILVKAASEFNVHVELEK
jgi:hypothetical protein